MAPSPAWSRASEDWQGELPWIREAGADGIILFENVAKSRGALQDDLRRDGFNVIGGSAYGDRLENDRAYRAGAARASSAFRSRDAGEFDDLAERQRASSPRSPAAMC